MAIGTALAYAFYAVGTLAAVDAMLTEPPKNKLADTGTPSGGSTQSSAQQIFTQGQPLPKAAAVPPPVQSPTDPNVTASMNALAMQTPPSAVGQAIVDNAIAAGKPLDVPYSPLGPQPAKAPATPDSFGTFLAGLNNAAGAMSKVAPLLGLGPQPERTRAMAGAAGGQPGQSLFQLPQRNTLAQILASLPRTYNG